MVADTEVSPEDVIAMPASDELFDGDAVPVLLELVTDKLKDYVTQQAGNDEPVSLLGFGMELIYQIGFADGRASKRR